MQFIIRRDQDHHVAFSPLQTPFAGALLKENSLPLDMTTVVLLDEAGAHIYSQAIFRMFPYMGFPYKIFAPIGLALSPLVDPVYSFIGRNRGRISKYWRKLFGHEIESYKDRMLGLDGKTVAQASSHGTGRS